MKIAISKDAARALRRMPADVAARIEAKIDQYARNPASLANNVTKLQGRQGLRLRVGDFRVIFAVDSDTMQALDIGPRGSIYD